MWQKGKWGEKLLRMLARNDKTICSVGRIFSSLFKLLCLILHIKKSEFQSIAIIIISIVKSIYILMWTFALSEPTGSFPHSIRSLQSSDKADILRTSVVQKTVWTHGLNQSQSLDRASLVCFHFILLSFLFFLSVFYYCSTINDGTWGVYFALWNMHTGQMLQSQLPQIKWEHQNVNCVVRIESDICLVPQMIWVETQEKSKFFMAFSLAKISDFSKFTNFQMIFLCMPVFIWYWWEFWANHSGNAMSGRVNTESLVYIQISKKSHEERIPQTYFIKLIICFQVSLRGTNYFSC